MARHRDFDAARAEHQGEPLTFRLAGQDFTIPRVPAGPMLDVAAAMAEGGLGIVSAFGTFLYDTVPPDQHAALKEALKGIDLPQAMEVATWLIEEAVNRPLGGASESSGGPSTNGDASTRTGRVDPFGMTARRFVAMCETLLVDTYGGEAVDEWLAAGVRDEVAERRRENAMAALMLGGEVG